MGVRGQGTAATTERGAVGVEVQATLKVGVFIQTVLDFVIIAFAIFMVIKGMNSLKKKEEETPAPPPGPTKEEMLLTEIRDILQQK